MCRFILKVNKKQFNIMIYSIFGSSYATNNNICISRRITDFIVIAWKYHRSEFNFNINLEGFVKESINKTANAY